MKSKFRELAAARLKKRECVNGPDLAEARAALLAAVERGDAREFRNQLKVIASLGPPRDGRLAPLRSELLQRLQRMRAEAEAIAANEPRP